MLHVTLLHVTLLLFRLSFFNEEQSYMLALITGVMCRDDGRGGKNYQGRKITEDRVLESPLCGGLGKVP